MSELPQVIDHHARRELVTLLRELLDYIDDTNEKRPEEAADLMPLARSLHQTLYRLFRNEPPPPLPPELALELALIERRTARD